MSCNCKLEADECTDGVAIFYPLQDGGMCSTRPCGNEENLSHIQQPKVCVLLGGSRRGDLRAQPLGTIKRGAAITAG